MLAHRWQLWKSHGTPVYFACTIKYSIPGEKPKHEALTTIGSSWDKAWKAFKDFFKLKTKKDWDYRFQKLNLGADAADAFVYTPPREGEPRGSSIEDFDEAKVEADLQAIWAPVLGGESLVDRIGVDALVNDI